MFVFPDLVCPSLNIWVISDFSLLKVYFVHWAVFHLRDYFLGKIPSTVHMAKSTVILKAFVENDQLTFSRRPFLVSYHPWANMNLPSGTPLEQRLCLLFVAFWPHSFIRYSLNPCYRTGISVCVVQTKMNLTHPCCSENTQSRREGRWSSSSQTPCFLSVAAQRLAQS